MRTTVTLDSDTEQLVRARMANKGVSFKQALNDAIRESQVGQPGANRYVLQPLSMGIPAIDLTKALQLAGELEDVELIRKMQQGK
jgi:hypothetical protein